MAATGESKPVKGTDLFEEGALQGFIKDGQMALEVVVQLEDGLKRLASASGSKKVWSIEPKTIKDAKDLNAEIDKSVKLETAFTEITKRKLVLQERNKILAAQQRKDAKEIARDELGLTTEYEKQQRALDKLILKKKAMLGTDKEQSLSYKVISAGIQDLDQRLKGFDDTVGKHTRHVGDYQGQIKALGHGLAGTSGLVSMLGQAIGVDTEEFHKLHEISKTITKSVREFTHATHLQHLANEEHTAGLVKEAVAVEAEAAAEAEANTVKTASIPIYGAIILAITAVGAAIYAYIQATEHEIELEEERSLAMDGTVIVSEKLRDAYNEHILSVGELADKYAILNGTMTEMEASMNKIRRGFLKTAADIKNESTKEIQEATGFWKSAGDAARDYFNIITLGNAGILGMDSGAEARQKRLDKIAKDRDENLKAEARKAQDEIALEAVTEEIKEKNKVKKAKETKIKIKQIEKEQDFNQPLFDYQDDLNNEEAIRKKKAEQDYDKWLDEFRAEQDRKEKERRRKRLEDAINQQQLILNSISQAMDKENQLRRSALEYQSGMIDAQIQTNIALAQAGLQNNLDFELKEKAKNIEQQKALDKKARQEKEVLQLAELYLEFMKVYAKDGPGAAGKALAQTLIAKGVSAAFVGAFKDGVENLDGDGTATSDSNLALLSKGESVVTARGTSENPGLATAMNKGEVDSYFEKIYMQKVSTNGKVNASNVLESSVSILHEDMMSLQRTIRDKKEMTVDRDIWKGLLRIIEKENGNAKVYIQQNHEIFQRGTYNS